MYCGARWLRVLALRHLPIVITISLETGSVMRKVRRAKFATGLQIDTKNSVVRRPHIGFTTCLTKNIFNTLSPINKLSSVYPRRNVMRRLA